MKTKVKFSKERLYKGVEDLAQAVGSTLGPKGRRVVIKTEHGPYITKDGVTVARFINPVDDEEWLGSQIVSQSAQATVQAAGDGTTTSIVLANEIIKLAKDLENPVDVIKGIEQASKDTLECLEEEKKEMSDEFIKHIAYISTNNDEELSSKIAEAFIESGEDGVVDVALDPASSEVTLDIRPGSFVPQGYSNAAFINNVKMRVAELNDPLVLVSTLTIDDHTKILHLLTHAIETETPFIIIADTDKNFDEAFIMNIAKKTMKGCILHPGQHLTSDMLKDFAKLINATYFDNSHGNNLEHIGVEDLGMVDKAVIGEGFSLFTTSTPGDVTENLETIKERMEEASNYEKKQLKQRLSMLNGKYATIKVGSPTQAETNEIKDRIDDAVFAVGAAQKFGYLPGGGVALRDTSRKLVTNLKEKEGTPFNLGYSAFLEALQSPFNKILDNAGIVEHPEGWETFTASGHGYNASTGRVVNMEEAGIIDPAYVTMQAVTNATSSAVALLSTEATIIPDVDESNK